MTTHLEDLDSPLAAEALRDFADVLTNWYVRRSRDRFWDGTDRDAFDTLYTVLETVSRVAAPLLPLMTEEMWRGLTGGRSVHLTDWPDAELFPEDPELVATMDRVREVVSSALALRKAKQLRVRLPLARLTVVSPVDLSGYAEIIADELNVKSIEFVDFAETSLDDFGITRRLTVNARALGPRIGGQVQQVIKASKSGDWSADGVVIAGGIELVEGEYELELDVADPSSAIEFLGDGGFVVLDTNVTPELEAEGAARDLIRRVQDARKAAGLDVSDRIALSLTLPAAEAAAARTHEHLIARETLAVEVAIGEGEPHIGVEKRIV